MPHVLPRKAGGYSTILSGRLELYDGVGILHDEDCDEHDVDEDPSESWYEKLPPFPYVHLFFDELIDPDTGDWGPWCCIHGHQGRTRAFVETQCSNDNQSR